MSEKKHALTIGYNSDGDADKLVEVQASALQVSSFDLADVASDHIPTENQVLAYSAVGDGTFLYAPSTIVTGGGGGGGGTFSLPTGAIGDILRYTATDAVNPISFTGAGLATTAIVEAASDALVPRDGAFTATGPATFATNPVSFPAGYNATGPITVTGPLDVTGPTTHEGTFTFDRKPKVGSTDIVIDSDLAAYATNANLAATGAALAATGALLATTIAGLDAYVTETEYDTSASLFTTTGTFFTTTGTLLEKPSTGGAGELLVYNAGNDTATTSVSDFLTDNSLVTFTNFGTQLGNNDGLTKTEAAGFSSTLFASAAFTTADGRAFINSNADLSNVGKVLTTTPTDGQVLAYDGNNWAPKTIVGGFGLISPGAKLEGAELVLETSNVLTTPPGTTGKGDTTVNKLIAFSGTDASSTKFVGSEFGIQLIQQPDQDITIGDNFIYFSANDSASGPVALPLDSNARSFMESGSATNVSASNLTVTRTGQMNPTCYIHESDWLTAGTAANGFGQSNTGTGAGTGQCFDNDVMHPDKGTIGVIEVRSGTDAFGRCFMTTFNNALAVSSCSVSFTSRIAPSGLWVNGSNEGKMSFGIRNGVSNAEPTYGMEFQYGAGGGAANTTWSAVVIDNSNSTVSDTGVVVSAQEFQVLQVSCNENWDTVDFYIDGVNKAQFTLAAGHNIPDSRFNRVGLAWSINNANIFSTSNTTDGNEIFVDWHQYRLKATTRVSGNRGKDLIQ